MNSFQNEGFFVAAPEEASKVALDAKEFGIPLASIGFEPCLCFFGQDGVEMVGAGQSFGVVPESRAKGRLEVKGCHFKPMATLEAAE